MKILIGEDDFIQQKIDAEVLEPLWYLEVVVDGEEAVLAFSESLENGDPFDLVCPDIMLPKKDGQQVLKSIRSLEASRGIEGSEGVTVIMTTAPGDAENIMSAFRSQCEGYLTQPVTRQRLLEKIKELGLFTDEA